MRKFKVTVNGVSYDVTVEECTGENISAHMQPSVSAPAKVEEKVTESVSQIPGVGEKITAPMPGTIVNVAVNVGDSVNSGDLLLVLEAMKMENEIFSPVSGRVTSVTTSQGANVNSGDVLLTIA